MDFLKLKTILKERGEPTYRFSQIASDVASGRPLSFNDIFAIPKTLREQLATDVTFISNQEVTVLASKDNTAYKALLELADGSRIETVLLNPKPALWSVCISCQVGCGMHCSFCATGQMGFIRNLTTEEITDQILFWKEYIAKQNLKIRICNVVYMGMGEPFANEEAVFESIRILTDPQIFGLGQRHLSVSTSGIIPGIEKFADTFPQVNLALSLHAPNDTLRSQIMPVNKAYPLDQLLSAINQYLSKTNRQLFIEYVLLSDVNDSDKQAIELGNLLSDHFPEQKHLLHVNLIVYNQTKSEYQASAKERARKFLAILEHFGISSTIRKSMGQEIMGACGQLTTKNNG